MAFATRVLLISNSLGVGVGDNVLVGICVVII